MCRIESDPKAFADVFAKRFAEQAEAICVESKCAKHGGTMPCNCDNGETTRGPEPW